jgi:amphi-Trp domain-containing protein
MSDVKVEYEQTISRDEAATLLAQLARAFSGEHDAEFPFGPGTVKLHVPGSVRAELEVEVEDDKVEVEIEFTWPLPQRNAGLAAAIAPGAKAATSRPERANGARRPPSAGRARRK